MITFKVDNLKNMSSCLKRFADYLRERDICDEDVFLSRLVSSELLSNVLRHSRDEAEFCGELLADRILITVTAEEQAAANLTPSFPEPLSESGRGLYIINAVSMDGITRETGGVLKVSIKRTDFNSK